MLENVFWQSVSDLENLLRTVNTPVFWGVLAFFFLVFIAVWHWEGVPRFFKTLIFFVVAIPLMLFSGRLLTQVKHLAPPVYSAVEAGNMALLHERLAAGADINARHPEGETPLMAAVRLCRTKAVEVLLEAGARVNLRDHDGRTALMYAASHCPEAAGLLVKAGAEERASDAQGRIASDYAARNNNDHRFSQELPAGEIVIQ